MRYKKLFHTLFLSFAFCCAGFAQDFHTYTEKLNKNLKQNVIPFWTARCIDRSNGGYTINFDPQGKPNGKSNKMIVTQSRMVWFFSRMARDGYERSKMLSDAKVGYHFLRDKMWDRKNGGFYWEVDATGDKQLNAQKILYGQSFALYGLSEYAMASHDPEALALATRLFQLLDKKSHDTQYGGYLESFNEDWTPMTGADSPMGPVKYKLMNTHLHLLESMTAYYRASKSTESYQRLVELINIQSNAVVRKNITGCTDKYLRDWTPDIAGNFARVSYGHDLENIWLLADACAAAHVSPYPFLDLFKAIYRDAYRYGFDQKLGGFFESGPFLKPADVLDKTWWVQAEALVCELYLYRMTHEREYWEAFTKTYTFVDEHQTDWKTGEWWETVRNGKGVGGKAHSWKSGYHNGRALAESLKVLDELAKP